MSKPTTPVELVQFIQDRERQLPWRERPTRRETLEALLECHARAVADRDAQHAEEEYDGAPMCRCETCTPGNYTGISRD